MARISTYSEDTSISNDDLLIGTDAEDSNVTKTYKVGDLKNFVKGSAVYVASFEQKGVAEPVVTELENTTGLTFTWTRDAPGSYFITPSSNFTVSDVWVQLTGGKSGVTILDLKAVTTTGLQVLNMDVDNPTTSVDDVNFGFIEIRIYP